MRNLCSVLALAATLSLSSAAFADDEPAKDAKGDGQKKEETAKPAKLVPKEVSTEGSVTVEGKRIDYKAVAGTLVLDDKKGDGTASIFYAAYFKKDADSSRRPVTFIYNGGPGSATVWLHMGAFGPKRVVTDDDRHTPRRAVRPRQQRLQPARRQRPGLHRCAGRRLLDVCRQGEGAEGVFRRRSRRERLRAVHQQVHVEYGRWNSPKYLFGESYGTTRSAVLANILQNDKAIDLNGVVLLSHPQLAMLIDFPQINPGVDLSYLPCCRVSPRPRGTTGSCRASRRQPT